MKKIICLIAIVVSLGYALVSCQKKFTPSFSLAEHSYEHGSKISRQAHVDEVNDQTKVADLAMTSTSKTSEVSIDKKAHTAALIKEAKQKIDYSKLSPKQAKRLEKLERKLAKKSGDDQLVALLLVIFVGCLGIHRFYLGYTWQGIVQLLTVGCCGVWALIDLIRIATGDLQPYEGSYSRTL